MRKAVLLACLLAAAIALSGCVNPLNSCNINTPELCNKSCVLDEDCSFNCGAGCINRNENFDFGGVTIFCDMAAGDCKCVEGQCQFVEAECGNGTCDVGENEVNCPSDCVEEQGCVGEGETVPVIAMPPECCAGLDLIQPKQAGIIGIAGYCTAKCGNGTCDAIESELNCPADCVQELGCVGEGGTIPVIAEPPECCQPFDLILPKEPGIIGISGFCTAKCGNGTCDTVESSYNCPADCG